MTLFLFIVTLVSQVVFAFPSPSCKLPSVKRLTLKVYPNRKDSPKFTWSFQYFRPRNPDAPTIVVIPGGPGIGIIEDWTEEGLKNFGLPEDAGLIFLDPRTVDCNEGDEKTFPDDALTTEYLAHDLLSAVKSLRAKNYILYGHSYGSVLATVAASLGEKMGMPAKAVILTGVVGKWVQGVEGSVFWGLKTEWEKLKTQLPAPILKRFARSDMPLSYTEDHWADIVENGLYLGRIMHGERLFHPLKEALVLLSENTPVADRKAENILHEHVPGEKLGKGEDDDGKWSQRLFEVIDCAELTNTEPTITLSAGKIVATGDECKDRPTLIRPYDSADYLTSSPTFYFTGTAEAVTFYSQARQHFENYRRSDRFLVTMLEGSHNRLGAYFHDCKEELWKAMTDAGKGLREAFQACKATQLMCAKGACEGREVFEFRKGQRSI